MKHEAREVEQYWKVVEKRLDAEVDGILKQIAKDEGPQHIIASLPLKRPQQESVFLNLFARMFRPFVCHSCPRFSGSVLSSVFVIPIHR